MKHKSYLGARNMKSTALAESGIVQPDGNTYTGARRRENSDELLRRANQTEQELELDMHLARSLYPLKSLADIHLAYLLRNSPIEVVFRGQMLFEADSYDRQHLFLLHGDIELTDTSGNVQLVGAGNSLGPVAHQQPRPSRAVAKTDCSILRVDSDFLDKMLTWSQVAEYLLLDISYQRDLDEDADWMMTILKSNLFFKVPPTNAKVIFDRLKTMEVTAGEAILRQGEIGDNCYFIREGEAEVRQSIDNISPPVTIAHIGPGRCFGEDALVNETVRNATVSMTTDGILTYITKREFLKLLKEPKVETADTDQVKNLMEAGTVCIDLRTEEEYVLGHLPQAVNIPLNLLRIKTRLLSKQQHYVLYCDSGRRSRAAAHLLRQSGFQVAALYGGLQAARSLPLVSGEENLLLRDGQVVQGS